VDEDQSREERSSGVWGPRDNIYRKSAGDRICSHRHARYTVEVPSQRRTPQRWKQGGLGKTSGMPDPPRIDALRDQRARPRLPDGTHLLVPGAQRTGGKGGLGARDKQWAEQRYRPSLAFVFLFFSFLFPNSCFKFSNLSLEFSIHIDMHNTNSSMTCIFLFLFICYLTNIIPLNEYAQLKRKSK
jgi:hypothetical protein